MIKVYWECARFEYDLWGGVGPLESSVVYQWQYWQRIGHGGSEWRRPLPVVSLCCWHQLHSWQGADGSVIPVSLLTASAFHSNNPVHSSLKWFNKEWISSVDKHSIECGVRCIRQKWGTFAFLLKSCILHKHFDNEIPTKLSSSE